MATSVYYIRQPASPTSFLSARTLSTLTDDERQRLDALVEAQRRLTAEDEWLRREMRDLERRVCEMELRVRSLARAEFSPSREFMVIPGAATSKAPVASSPPSKAEPGMKAEGASSSPGMRLWSWGRGL